MKKQNKKQLKRYKKKTKYNSKSVLGLPKSPIIFALFILIFFGLVSTTFGAFSSNNFASTDDVNFEVPHIAMSVRNSKINADLVSSGAKSDLSQISAQYNRYWKGKVYFLAPEKWDISTYSHVQVDITRTTSTSSSNYQFYSGDMTRVGSSRLFYLNLSIDHSGWNQNEYIAFTANSSTYGPGTFAVSGNHYYTTPIDYGCDNSSNYYLFVPSTESQYTTTTNGNTISGSWNSNRSTLLKKTQTVNITTNGSSSDSGGTVTMTGYYDTGDTTVNSSSVTSSSTSVSYDGIEGTEMKLEAASKSYYAFDGWYSGSTKLSSNATYTYNVYSAKTITAKFVDAKYTVTAGTCNGGTVSVTTSPATHNTGTTVTANASTGCTFSKWKANSNGSFTSSTSPSTTFKPNTNATVEAEFTLNKPSVAVPTTTIKPEYNSTYYPRDSITLSHDYSSATFTTKVRIVRDYDSYETSYEGKLSEFSFSANTPGKYTVYVSAKAIGYSLESSYTTETSYNLYVLPPTPDLTNNNVVASGYDSGSGTESDPYKVPRNSTSFSLTITASDTYDSLFANWYTPVYRYNINNTWYDGTGTYQKTYVFKPSTTASTSPVTINARIIVNGVGGHDSSAVSIYYEIVDNFLTFEDYSMPQLIFDNDDNPINYYLKIYSGKTEFNTQFKYSNSNLSGTFNDLGGLISNMPKRIGTTSYFEGTFNIADILNSSGVYFLKANVKSSDNQLDKTTDNSIKFVKGTSNYLSKKVIYFETSGTDIDFSSNRIMICYSDNINSPSSGNTTWVTMNKILSGANRYKAYIPSNVSTLAFYVMKPNYYDTSNVLHNESIIAYTQFISIDDDYNCFSATDFDTSSPIMMTGSFGPLS